MTANEFRRIALSLPETAEHSHMGHPDFRVNDRIFATLGYPDDDHGMVILPPDQQGDFVREYPDVFSPAKGAWGKSGSTIVRLAGVNKQTLQRAIELAWRKRARISAP